MRTITYFKPLPHLLTKTLDLAGLQQTVQNPSFCSTTGYTANNKAVWADVISIKKVVAGRTKYMTQYVPLKIQWDISNIDPTLIGVEQEFSGTIIMLPADAKIAEGVKPTAKVMFVESF